jgi:hypothetical protein
MEGNPLRPVERVRVRTEVHNTGSDIADDDAHRVFKPWSQVSKPREICFYFLLFVFCFTSKANFDVPTIQIRANEQQAGQGSGLGLALCKDFIERGHGGTIGFYAAPGKGTTFYFEINYVVQRNPPKKHGAEARSKLMKASLPRASSTSSLSDPKLTEVAVSQQESVDIVIVDDSSMTRSLLARTVGALGLTHREFEHGEQVSHFSAISLGLFLSQAQTGNVLLSF